MPAILQEHDVVILRDPRVLGGQAIVAGHRVPVWMIMDEYDQANDPRAGIARVRAAYEGHTDEEIMAAVHHARRVDPEGIWADRQAYYDAIPEHLRD